MSDCRRESRPQGVAFVVRCPLHGIYYTGVGLVLLLAAAGHLAILIGILRDPDLVGVLLGVGIAAPGIACVAIGLSLFRWRREVVLDLGRGVCTFRDRRWRRWHETSVPLEGVTPALRPFYDWLYRGSYEGVLLELAGADVRPLVLEHGSVEKAMSAARAFAGCTGMRVEVDPSVDID